MKSRYLLLIMVMLCTFMTVSSQTQEELIKQNPKYGKDPEKRVENVRMLQLFMDEMQLKNYNEASVHLRGLIENAPIISENMYIRGVEIYRNKFLSSTSKEDRARYLDSIMTIFDKRIEAFGDNPKLGTAYIKAEKARLYQNLAPADQQKVFELFRNAIEAGKANLDPKLVVAFFQTLTESYRLDDISPNEYIDDYEKLSQLLLANGSEDSKEAAATLEAFFVDSGVANCETIESIYKPKYEANPGDQDLVKKILGLMQRAKCNNDFQMALVEKYYQIDPSPEMALMLASLYDERGNLAKSEEYMNIAISGQTDPVQKANLLIQSAGNYLGASNYRKAADLARQVMNLDPNNAYGYFFYASAVAGAVSVSCSGFEQQAAYWLVVDLLQQARSRMSSDQKTLDDINRMIGTYTANFPKSDEAFMNNLNQGNSYQVNCGWVSGRTTVRVR